MIIYRTNITGLAHSGYKLFASKVVPGGELTMHRDPENAYDKFAIRLLMPDGTQLGWVQRIKDVEQSGQTVISNLLDAGVALTCTIESINPDLKEAEGKLIAAVSIQNSNAN